ncbi:MAG: zinc-ribbon domain-containing protein [Deltaproteobacteria bacterium]|nr:zinc-ribbon domain-containing protein [Deltaproteobacteria bacterium]MBW2662423.1 zinc-ribbon domain-containing protein [Deltaproteobacteria bacterium]
MNVVCEQCQSKFKIPDEKIPKGQIFTLSCPKCKNKITIDTSRVVSSLSKEEIPEPETVLEKTIIDEINSGTYDASEKPFDFVEEGSETVLLCETDPVISAKIRSVLKNMGYNIIEPETARDSLKQMRFHVFDLIVLNETFDTRDLDENNVLMYLDRLSMSIRRNIFVVLLTSRFRTMDKMTAFNKSVNIVINLKNLDEIEKILKASLIDNIAFYKVFKELLVKTGKV